MQVILKETIDTLGAAGSIVKVKDGYARNFLIPEDLAAPATAGMARQMEHIKRLAEKKRLTEVKTAGDLKDRLEGMTVEIEARVGAQDKLYGSVTNGDIAKALAEQGVELNRRKIALPQAIRVTGEHTVHVKVDPEVTADLKVIVTATAESQQTLEDEAREAEEARVAAEAAAAKAEAEEAGEEGEATEETDQEPDAEEAAEEVVEEETSEEE